MARPLSKIAPQWWDYTTLPKELVDEVAQLKVKDIENLSRDGFRVVMYDTIEDLWISEALEYIEAWTQATPDRPVGICGPIGPTEQLPLVARLVNALEINLKHAHFDLEGNVPGPGSALRERVEAPYQPGRVELQDNWSLQF